MPPGNGGNLQLTSSGPTGKHGENVSSSGTYAVSTGVPLKAGVRIGRSVTGSSLKSMGNEPVTSWWKGIKMEK